MNIQKLNTMIINDLTFKGKNGRDDFGREKIAEKIINLLTSDINISPLVIDGDWGSGKTEFCHKLINKIIETESIYRTIYIDSFQADHADNPLMTILSAVINLFPEGTKKTTLLEKSIPVLRYGLATIGKAVVSHALKQNTDEIIDGFDERLQEVADKAIDASVQILLKDHEKAQENIKALQKTLESLAEDSPIIVFIDELDRCRPDYAVDILEVIKHTLNVPNVYFVLITNTHQLKAAINHRYGNQVNAQRYLDKFVKFSFSLPNFIPGIKRYGESKVFASPEHFSNLVLNSNTLKETKLIDKHHISHEFTKNFIELAKISLREVETFLLHLEIYQRLTNGLQSNISTGYLLLRIFGVYIYCFSPDTVRSIQNNNADANHIANIFELNGLPDKIPDHHEWSHVKDFGIILARNCKINKDMYLSDNQSLQEYWDNTSRRFFSDNWGVTPDDLYATVRETIDNLRLGGK